MQKQFSHEHHNRQDKTRKPDYREDLRFAHRKRRAKKPASNNYAIRVRHRIDYLAPVVVRAIHRLSPDIDCRLVVDAINSELGKLGAIANTSSTSQSALAAAFHEAEEAVKQFRVSIAGRFLEYHDLLAKIEKDFPGGESCVAAEFHKWLLKMERKKSAATLENRQTKSVPQY
jgi:hypothetical protein